MGTLRLSKEHGVNPSIPECLYCGKPKNEVVLFGASYKDENGRPAKAPMHCGPLDSEPCEECAEKFKGGIILIEAARTATGRVLPTGPYCVVTEDGFKAVFNVPVPAKRRAYVEPGLIARILPKEGGDDPHQD